MLSPEELEAAKKATYYGRAWTTGGYTSTEAVPAYKRGETEA